MKTSLGVIFGSRTCEHDVSIITGLQAAMAADSESYEVTRVYIARDGSWYIGDKLSDMAFYIKFDPSAVTRVLPVGEDGKLLLIEYPTDKRRLLGGGRHVLRSIDVVLPAMHGLNGEDGTLQGLLEMLNVPYTSSGVMSSAVGMDKITMKQLFRGCGLPVLPDTFAERRDWDARRSEIVRHVEETLGYPVFVKPANLGSSIGISRATDRESFERAMDIAVSYDRRVLIEKGVTKIEEVNCSALGYGAEVRISETEMPINWEDKDFLDFYEKYMSGSGKGMSALKRKIPAPIAESEQEKIKELTKRVFTLMDCRGVVRIDYIIDRSDDTIYLGEINTIPGSLAFYLWEPVGVSFSALIDEMVKYAFEAWSDKNRSVFSFESNILTAVRSGAKGAKHGAKG